MADKETNRFPSVPLAHGRHTHELVETKDANKSFWHNIRVVRHDNHNEHRNLFVGRPLTYASNYEPGHVSKRTVGCASRSARPLPLFPLTTNMHNKTALNMRACEMGTSNPKLILATRCVLQIILRRSASFCTCSSNILSEIRYR